MLHTFSDDEAEARVVVEQIDYARSTKRAAWSDHAMYPDIPHECSVPGAGNRVASSGRYLSPDWRPEFLHDRREIRDFIAYLKSLLNPNDDVSLRCAFASNVPARGLSDVTMERILAASQERKCSVFAAMKNPVRRDKLPNQRPVVHRTVRGSSLNGRKLELQIDALSAHAPAPLQILATNEFLDEIGYSKELKRSEKNPETAEGRIRNLMELTASLDGNNPEKLAA